MFLLANCNYTSGAITLSKLSVSSNARCWLLLSSNALFIAAASDNYLSAGHCKLLGADFVMQRSFNNILLVIILRKRTIPIKIFKGLYKI